jgi:hypothetical protein
LRNCGQREFELRAATPTQPKAAEPEDAVEVGEQHLDTLAVVTRLLERLVTGEFTSDFWSIFSIFVEVAESGYHSRLCAWL